MDMKDYRQSAERMMLGMPENSTAVYVLAGILGLAVCAAAVAICLI